MMPVTYDAEPRTLCTENALAGEEYVGEEARELEHRVSECANHQCMSLTDLGKATRIGCTSRASMLVLKMRLLYIAWAKNPPG